MSDTLPSMRNLFLPEFKRPDEVPIRWTVSPNKAIHAKLPDEVYYRLQHLVNASDYDISKTGVITLLLARLFAAHDRGEETMSTKLPQILDFDSCLGHSDITACGENAYVASGYYEKHLSSKEKARVARYEKAQAEWAANKANRETSKEDSSKYFDTEGNEISEEDAVNAVKSFLIKEGLTTEEQLANQ